MGYIYKITNKINDKIYIGQTIRQPKIRFWEHITKYNRKKYHLHKAIQKYGKENFTIEIIEECDNSLLDDREKFWIKELNTYHYGYNENRGGNGNKGYGKKAICQYDMGGNFIKEYSGVKEAERELGLINGSSISNAINHKQYCAYGCLWCVKGEKPIVKETTTQKKPVEQYDLKGNKINEYRGIREAVRLNNFNIGAMNSIIRCCRNMSKSYKGYIWKYKYQ